jgi:hypothetical protein
MQTSTYTTVGTTLGVARLPSEAERHGWKFHAEFLKKPAMKIDWGPQHPQQYADSALVYLMDGNSPFDAPRDEQGNLRKALELREPAAQPTIPNDLSCVNAPEQRKHTRNIASV